jgi:glucose-1-phosphate thymidylyltransferase
MIYYPLSTLMLGGIREILVVCAPRDLRCFMELLGNGSRLGISISYAEQARGEGTAKTFLTAERFIGRDSVCLILGDNIFYGGLNFLREAPQFKEGAMIFACHVKDPERHTVVEFDRTGRAVRLEAKPRDTRSNYAVTGLYVYDDKVVEISRALAPSCKGRLEITDVNREYLRRGELRVRSLSRDIAWLDAGTESDLLEATRFIANVEKRQGLKIGCVEEAAFRMGYINAERLERLVHELPKNSYREYLRRLATTSSDKPQRRMIGYLPDRTSQAVGAAR